jgi:hypothetical protein
MDRCQVDPDRLRWGRHSFIAIALWTLKPDTLTRTGTEERPEDFLADFRRILSR